MRTKAVVVKVGAVAAIALAGLTTFDSAESFADGPIYNYAPPNGTVRRRLAAMESSRESIRQHRRDAWGYGGCCRVWRARRCTCRFSDGDSASYSRSESGSGWGVG